MKKTLFVCWLAFCFPLLGSWEEEFLHLVAHNSPPQWMQSQIDADFAHLQPHEFAPASLDALMSGDWEEGRYVLARYKIHNNSLYSTYRGNFATLDRCLIFEQVLRELLKLVVLEDIDFVVCLGDFKSRGDHSILLGEGVTLLAPLLTFTKNSSLKEKAILIPDYENLQGNHHVERVEEGNGQFPWEQKIAKAFWRGAMTGTWFTRENFLSTPRSSLILQSLLYPEWIDARYSVKCQCDDLFYVSKKFTHFFGSNASIQEHLRYKYQILVDGNTCAYTRALWQFFSNCLIFKQYSPHIQWYYGALQDDVHYITVSPDFYDLVEKIKWAEAHPEKVQAIIGNAQKFARENLRRAHCYYYLYLVLKKYAETQA